MARCAGCRSAPGPVCPDCKGLSVGEVVTRRATWPSFMPLLMAGALVAIVVYFSWESGYWGEPLELLLPVPVLVLWALRRLRRPHRFRLVRDRLEHTSVLGGTRIIPLADLRDDKGVVVHVSQNVRYPVGAARFDGAEAFHRALRVRLALRGDAGAQRPFC